MGDEEIRSLLAGLRPVVSNRPPGMVRVLHEAVEKRGADLRLTATQIVSASPVQRVVCCSGVGG